MVRRSSGFFCAHLLATTGQKFIEVLGNFTLDLILERAEQETQLGVQLEVVIAHAQRACHAWAAELQFIAVFAFGVGAGHFELLLRCFGPLGRDGSGALHTEVV